MKFQRILIVSEPGVYGVFFIVRQLIRFLHRAHPEITVDFAYSSRRSWPETFALVDEVRARGGEAIDLQVGNSPGLGDLPALVQLLRLVRRRSPQVVHAHSSKAGGLCRLLAFLPGFPPVLYTPHAYYGLGRQGGLKEIVFNTLEAILGRRGLTQVVVGDERRFARETLKLPARSLVLINTGIMAEQFVPATAAQKAAARDKLGIPREGKLLVTTGRNGPQKNYPPLYAALDRFLPAYPGVLFAHAGAGSLQLRERIHPDYRGRCYCFDFMADVRELLWAADGFILTSFYEAPSLSMLEAFSCGLPLLLTDAPGFSRMRVFGWQIDWMPAPKGCVDFATEVFTALKSWNERPAVSLAPQHAFALQNFNTPTQFSKVVRVYERLARKA